MPINLHSFPLNMKLIYTCFILLLTCFISTAQNLTGIWRGYFAQKISYNSMSGKFIEDKYKYELQINNLTNNSIEGVTYSYKTTLFYGKASTQGIYTKKTKNLLIKEVKMLELRISNQSSACLMTCYLEYKKSADGKKETLTGNYTSVNETDGSDCGNGRVYLERVTTTEFEKEDFIIKNENKIAKNKNGIFPRLNNNTDKENKPSHDVAVKPVHGKTAMKPGAEDFVIVKPTLKKGQKIPNDIDTSHNTSPIDGVQPTSPSSTEDTTEVLEVPEKLAKRENVLSHSLVVDAQDVTVEFLDNGQIDGDTISVYHNNRIIIDRKRLGYAPITMKVHIDEKNPVYEFIAVAENLGAVPPNTALVIINSGTKHYEINITSDEQRNAKIVLEFQKPPVKKLN